VGSIDVGKDADLAIYNHDPLSVYAVAQKVLIDGHVYFDRSQDLAQRAALDKEKQALLDKEKKAAEDEKKADDKSAKEPDEGGAKKKNPGKKKTDTTTKPPQSDAASEGGAR
jgi:adenine deaminase